MALIDSPPAAASDGIPQWSVVLGRADDMRAEVYVRLAGTALRERREHLRITGTLVGPQCERATTLPITVPLTAIPSVAAAGCEPIARAILTEPSYWTPELPNLYRLQAQLMDGTSLLETCDCLVGLRRLGVRGRSFWLESRRFVLRGMAADGNHLEATALHEAGAAAVIVNPTLDVCERADRSGVAIAAILPEFPTASFDLVSRLAHIAAWARHPSVVLVVIPRPFELESVQQLATQAQKMKGTMLLGLEVDGTAPPPRVLPKEIDFLAVCLPPATLPDAQWREHTHGIPLVARRPDVLHSAGHRSDCDQLQAALAAWGMAAGEQRLPWDWAGYCVG